VGWYSETEEAETEAVKDIPSGGEPLSQGARSFLPARRGGRERWVPFRIILGTDAIPPDVAVLLRQVVVMLVESGDVSEKARWQALEFVLADFLAGPPRDGPR
jgi:hypothetical protein